MDIKETMMDEMEQNQGTPSSGNLTQLGVRLKKARQTLQLEEKDAAARLHLSVKFIDMMENGNLDEKLPPTFLRGYFKSYAKMLNISEEEVNNALNEVAEPPAIVPLSATLPKKPVLLPGNTPSNTERYIRLITYVIPLVLIVLVGLWWNSHSRYSVSDIPTSPSKPTETIPPTPEKIEPAPTTTPVTPLPTETPTTSEQPAPSAATASEPVAPAVTVQIPAAVNMLPSSPTESLPTAAAPEQPAPVKKPKYRRIRREQEDPGLEFLND